MDTSNWTEKDFISHWIKTKDILSFCIYEFDLKPHEYPTPTQCKIMKKILFDGCRRLLLNCHTRFGKSRTLGMLTNLYIIFNRDKKVNIIAPQWSQTYIIRKEAAKFLERSRTLKDIAHWTKTSEEGTATTEASKKRQTFKNGCEINTLGVQGDAKGAMGEGGDFNIVDELGLMAPATFREKVFRLLGDNPETSIMVAAFNPWGSDNIAADLWNNPNWERIHVDWRQGIKEGRLTEEYVQEQKDILTDIEFEVLFESKFPKTALDVILLPEQIRESIDRDITLTGNLKIEIGVDVARFGKDKTVIACRIGYKCWYLEKYSKEDTMTTAGRVSRLIRKYVDEGYPVIVNIDDTGLGGGVTDRLKEMHDHEAEINGIVNGSKPNNERYFNKITELWMWIKENIDIIELPNDPEVISDFSKRKYKLHSDGKQIRLESKDDMKKRGLKSPDVADAIANCFASETSGSHDAPLGGFV